MVEAFNRGLKSWRGIVPYRSVCIAGRRRRMRTHSRAQGSAMFIELFVLIVLVAVVIIAMRPPRK